MLPESTPSIYARLIPDARKKGGLVAFTGPWNPEEVKKALVSAGHSETDIIVTDLESPTSPPRG